MRADMMGDGPPVAGLEKRVSSLALGTAWCTLQRRDACFRLLDEYAARGGTVFDTARCYRRGEGERLLGEWLRARGVREDWSL